MRSIQLFAVCGVAATVGCSASSPRTVASTKSTTPVAERTVFTDSVMHSQECAPATPGADWRKVCVPKNQGVLVKPKP